MDNKTKELMVVAIQEKVAQMFDGKGIQITAQQLETLIAALSSMPEFAVKNAISEPSKDEFSLERNFSSIKNAKLNLVTNQISSAEGKSSISVSGAHELSLGDGAEKSETINFYVSAKPDEKAASYQVNIVVRMGDSQNVSTLNDRPDGKILTPQATIYFQQFSQKLSAAILAADPMAKGWA